MTSPLLSLVIPTYNEEARIAQTLDRVVAYLGKGESFELIIADDGSTDQTKAIVKSSIDRYPQIRLVACPTHRGKGSAVRTGMLDARGRFVCFSDADLSTPISTLDPMICTLTQGWDMVIASRALLESEITLRQHPFRETMGKAFNLMVRSAFSFSYRDTQCGFKAFRREVAQLIFSKSRIDGFAFDVETLLIAQHLGFSVKEIAVRWENAPGSTVNLIAHPFEMCRDLWRMYGYLRQGLYDCSLNISNISDTLMDTATQNPQEAKECEAKPGQNHQNKEYVRFSAEIANPESLPEPTMGHGTQ